MWLVNCFVWETARLGIICYKCLDNVCYNRWPVVEMKVCSKHNYSILICKSHFFTNLHSAISILFLVNPKALLFLINELNQFAEMQYGATPRIRIWRVLLHATSFLHQIEIINDRHDTDLRHAYSGSMPSLHFVLIIDNY